MGIIRIWDGYLLHGYFVVGHCRDIWGLVIKGSFQIDKDNI